jgi:cysteine-rich repeat protein
MVVAAALAGAIPAWAADVVVLGKKTVIKKPPNDKRSIIVLMKETGTPYGTSGAPDLDPGNDPETNGATLFIQTDPGNFSDEKGVFYTLTGSFNGPASPGWKKIGTGWTYKDPQNVAGPVKVVLIKKTPTDVLLLKAVVKDPSLGFPVDLLPPAANDSLVCAGGPNDGLPCATKGDCVPPQGGDCVGDAATAGNVVGVALKINGGDRFSGKLGGPAGGDLKKNDIVTHLIVASNSVPASEAGVIDVCGDGSLSGSEACDDGCAAGTASPVCDSPSDDDDGCDSNCTVTACGNGITTSSEECDDGDVVETNGCTNACTDCGNGVTTAPETCDDGDLDSGDGCDANCQPTGCGNGVTFAPETCDDGNTSDNDNCPSDCIVDSCTPVIPSSTVVTVNVSSGGAVSALTVLLIYPEGAVNLAGSGQDADASVAPAGGTGFTSANDLDHAVRVAASAPFGFPPNAIPDGALMTVDFEKCSGEPNPVPGDFSCVVLAASDTAGAPLGGVTCSASAVVP